jgi:hypothetical protein
MLQIYQTCRKGKVHEHALKVYWGRVGLYALILNVGIRRKSEVSFTIRLLYSQWWSAWFLLTRSPYIFQSWSGCIGGENSLLPLLGIEPWFLNHRGHNLVTTPAALSLVLRTYIRVYIRIHIYEIYVRFQPPVFDFRDKLRQKLSTRISRTLRQISDCSCRPLYQISNYCVHQNSLIGHTEKLTHNNLYRSIDWLNRNWSSILSVNVPTNKVYGLH